MRLSNSAAREDRLRPGGRFVRPGAWMAICLCPLTLLIAACTGKGPDNEFDTRGAPGGGAISEPAENPVAHWPLEPPTLEEQLATGRIEILSERYAGAGMTGASRVELRLLDLDRTITVKWKRVPPFLDTLNNSPRRELAAYEVLAVSDSNVRVGPAWLKETAALLPTPNPARREDPRAPDGLQRP